jgi:hypothetical protein
LVAGRSGGTQTIPSLNPEPIPKAALNRRPYHGDRVVERQLLAFVAWAGDSAGDDQPPTVTGSGWERGEVAIDVPRGSAG